LPSALRSSMLGCAIFFTAIQPTSCTDLGAATVPGTRPAALTSAYGRHSTWGF